MKALFYGVAIATAAGLMCGGALKIRARMSQTPEGPQMLVSGPTVRDPQPYDPLILTAYGAQPPSYVVGTDWLQPVAYAAIYVDPPAETSTGGQAIREAVHETPAPYAPPPGQTQVVYPSLDGDILAGIGKAPPAPYRRAEALDRLGAINAQIAMDADTAAARIARSPS